MWGNTLLRVCGPWQLSCMGGKFSSTLHVPASSYLHRSDGTTYSYSRGRWYTSPCCTTTALMRWCVVTRAGCGVLFHCHTSTALIPWHVLSKWWWKSIVLDPTSTSSDSWKSSTTLTVYFQSSSVARCACYELHFIVVTTISLPLFLNQITPNPLLLWLFLTCAPWLVLDDS